MSEGGDQEEAPHPAEWLVGSVSATAILALIGFLAFAGFRDDARPPSFAIAVEQAGLTDNGYRAIVAVENTGDVTAEGAVLRGTLTVPGAPPEIAEIDFAYLPPRSTRRAALIFARDPEQGRLDLAIVAYTEP